MIQPIHLIGSTYCLPIPDKYAQINIDPVFNELYWWSHEGVETTIPLPTGNWEIICTTKECTETIAAKIVEKDGAFFKCYAGKRSHISPLRSLFCLMDERKCDLNKTLLIIKKVS